MVNEPSTYYQGSRYEKLAVAAMVCGILCCTPVLCLCVLVFTETINDHSLWFSLFLWFLGSLPGVLGLIFGIIGLKSIDNRRIAIVGIVCSSLAIFLFVLIGAFFVVGVFYIDSFLPLEYQYFQR